MSGLSIKLNWKRKEGELSHGKYITGFLMLK